MISGEEILCPIFTIPGNHDYRPFHYDFRWGSLYRKIGLNASEAIALNDKTIANPISSITKSFRALIGYLSDINPSLNYTMRFGQDLFIFLDTGSDSFRNIRDFISGHPSVTGVSNEQIKYLENIINHQLNEEDEVFLLVHGPPINPKSGFNPFKIFGRKKASNPFKAQLEEYKESKMKSQGYTSTDARIETDFNVKYGAISSNWEKIILFCRDFTKFSFSGHTHSKKEFRLTDPRGNKTKEKFAPPIILRKIENPAAIYYDDYSDVCETPEEIEENAPFVLQTPALGLGGYRNPNYAGGYREIQIVDGKVVSFKVKFINKDFLRT